jgi:hypothetical protein
VSRDGRHSARRDDPTGAPAQANGLCDALRVPEHSPAGLTFSRTAEATAEQTADDEIKITIGGGPVLADDPGDFVLSIEVPDDLSLEHEALYDEPEGWPFREIWLPEDVANRYRDTLKVYDPIDEEEIPLDLVGK